MEYFKLILSSSAIFICLLGPVNLRAQQANNDADKWDVTIAPYLLFASSDGESSIGWLPATQVEANFGDILKVLDLSLMLHGEVQKGKWGLILDFIYVKLGDDLSTPTKVSLVWN